ncbi:PglZ domain-containing protein [Methanocella sp. MCL-LM]|uniref:PglZ domain-containing protein n=1 Tax=Methanocella sp. MCL-LM TaxID=3412035 RepID=UPI003C71855D
MTAASDSFHAWLKNEISSALAHKANVGLEPFIIWCDPENEWNELLIAVSDGSFEIWADEEHELITRARFYSNKRAPRVVWLPVSREDITYFKVFESYASDVKVMSLAQAISTYSDIPQRQLSDLTNLRAYVKEYFDKPKVAWKELIGGADSKIVDDEKVLQVLASEGQSFEELLGNEVFPIFSRRVVDDLGLPQPDNKDADGWRIRALATLLCTEAAKKSDVVPGDHDKIIKDDSLRNAAIKLLSIWQKRVDLQGHFESLAKKADDLTSLRFWAKSLTIIPDPMASPAVENTLFIKEVEKLSSIDTFEEMAKYLDTHVSCYREHAASFWGKRATGKVQWYQLVIMASVASLLYRNDGVEKQWRNTADAVQWYVNDGWKVDLESENIFKENPGIPGILYNVIVKLRKAYLRHLDRVNVTFSELLATSDLEDTKLKYAGEQIKDLVEASTTKNPVAVVVLDACRYDLGQSIAYKLNEGEPEPRASVEPVLAPIPTATPIGMPFCLPGIIDKIHVDRSPKGDTGLLVTADGFDKDLTIAAERREWLKSVYKLKDKQFVSVNDILDPGKSSDISVKSLGRLLFVYGDDFDTQGHEGQLKLTGSEDHVERYALAVKRLRNMGYSTVVIVTDHGFFHWEPDPDEVEPEKPSGEVLWLSRRAAVGIGLSHKNAIKLKVPKSDLECMVPRSVNSFKTYGSLGFFHGGTTLEELIIPVVTARWPKKAQKITVVLKPISDITSLTQKIVVAPGATQTDLSGGVDKNQLSCQVIIKIYKTDGRLLFKSKCPVTVQPGGEPEPVEIVKVEGESAPFGSALDIRLLDADNEQVLETRTVTLKVEIDEWL